MGWANMYFIGFVLVVAVILNVAPVVNFFYQVFDKKLKGRWQLVSPFSFCCRIFWGGASGAAPLHSFHSVLLAAWLSGCWPSLQVDLYPKLEDYVLQEATFRGAALSTIAFLLMVSRSPRSRLPELQWSTHRIILCATPDSRRGGGVPAGLRNP